jgi:hypothetical protein
MPSEYNLTIHDYGINFATRRYWSEELIGKIGRKCEIRYDPSDLRTIWVLLDLTFVNIGCSRMRSGDSINYESYKKSITISRLDPDRRQIPVGSHTDEYGLEAEERSDAIVAKSIANTAGHQTPSLHELGELPAVSVDDVTTLASPILDSKPIVEDDVADDLKPQIIIDHDDF